MCTRKNELNREQKISLIASLRSDFSSAQASFLVGVKGLSVAQMQILRREICAKGGRLRVAKNRLLKLAIADVDTVCALEGYLKEQVGVVFAADEFTQVAKVLFDFSKSNPALSLVVGCLESGLIDKEKIVLLAALPSKEVLLGRMLGAMQSPTTGLVFVLNGMMLKLMWALKRIADQKK